MGHAVQQKDALVSTLYHSLSHYFHQHCHCLKHRDNKEKEGTCHLSLFISWQTKVWRIVSLTKYLSSWNISDPVTSRTAEGSSLNVSKYCRKYWSSNSTSRVIKAAKHMPTTFWIWIRGTNYKRNLTEPTYMVWSCPKNGRRKITQNSIEVDAVTKESMRKTEEKLDGRYKEGHEWKKPKWRPVGR